MEQAVAEVQVWHGREVVEWREGASARPPRAALARTDGVICLMREGWGWEFERAENALLDGVDFHFPARCPLSGERDRHSGGAGGMAARARRAQTPLILRGAGSVGGGHEQNATVR